MEFALTSTVLFMVIFGIIDCCRALYVYHYVAAAAREGTRYAAVRGATWSSLPCLTVGTYSCTATATSVSSYLSSTMPPGANVANLTVTTTWPGTTAVGTDCSSTDVNNAPGCMVNVKVTYAFNFVLPFLPRQAYVLSSTSKIAITQ